MLGHRDVLRFEQKQISPCFSSHVFTSIAPVKIDFSELFVIGCFLMLKENIFVFVLHTFIYLLSIYLWHLFHLGPYNLTRAGGSGTP